MRQIAIEVDHTRFEAEQKRSGNGKVPPISPAKIGTLPWTATILIGNRTEAMGGGLAGTGYVMQGGKATHSIGVSATDIQQRFLRVP